MTRRMVVIFTVFFAMATAHVGRAHHDATSMFDLNTNLVMTATLVKYEAINPHSYMTVKMNKPDGTQEEWQLEALAAVSMRQRGLSIRDNLKPGQQYKIVYSPSRNGKPVGFLSAMVLDDGRFVAFGPTTNITAARQLLGK